MPGPEPNPAPPPQSIRLRDVAPADIPALFQIQLDPDGNRMAGTKPRDLETFNSIWAKIFAERTVVGKVILADDELVGSISCFKMEGQDAIGYWIAREHWGRGIATRALALMLEEVKIRPLHASAARNNAASIRVLERCGFTVTAYKHAPATDRFEAREVAYFLLE